MNKVISFSLYGNNNLYCLGLIENINIINLKYVDWKIYVYYNNIPDKILSILKNKSNTFLFKCIDNGYNWEGMFWRFFPFNSNDIDIFLSRDTDSRITDREFKLVNDWIESNKRHLSQLKDSKWKNYNEEERRHYHKVHTKRVLNFFKDKELLVLDICGGDGYEKLCPFLGIDIPDEPFPYKHKRSL